jgi:hypothetical protein
VVPVKPALRTAWLLLAAAITPGTLAAQISPGQLARAHESLEGNRQCITCHGIGGREAMAAQCLACHRDIGWLIERRRGLHDSAAVRRCESCHPDHAGRDFQLVRWPGGGVAERFDHRLAGWPLDGAHTRVRCTVCHAPQYRVSPATGLAPRPGRSAAPRWVGLERACASCHEDPHRGQLSARCGDCHSTDDFRRVAPARMNHDHTRYPLRGGHAAVKCEACHDFSRRPGARRNPPFATCGGCHADAHAGTAVLAGSRPDCDACHTVRGFSPASLSVAAHGRTRYPLEGKHGEVRCAACHRQAANVALWGTARAVLRPAFARCRDCHAEDHGTQLAARSDGGECAACHTPRGWRPSGFRVAQHATLRFALRERHAEIECRACHGPGREGLRAVTLTRARLGTAGVLFGAEAACEACHVDPHRWTAARPCGACHGARAFRPSAVDVAAHAKLGFALAGAHRAVPCVACHDELGPPPRPRSTLVRAAREWPALSLAAPTACLGCHRDPHGAQFTARRDRGRCDGCHGVEAWAPAGAFDHNRDAAFRLDRAHEGVPCARCHRARAAAGAAVTVYRPLSGACETCHTEKPPGRT